jgi:hypothetical protein
MNFIDNINQAWRFASVRLALIAGLFAAWVASQPADFAALVEMLPPWARPLLGFAVFAIATLSRVTTIARATDSVTPFPEQKEN